MKEDFDLTEKAAEVAYSAHQGQRDKLGNAYWRHLYRVALTCHAASPEVIAVAWLHDVLEDTKVTEEELRGLFPEAVVDAVVALTRKPHEPTEDYLTRVLLNDLAPLVKVADMLDNVKRLPELALKDPETAERLRKKYTKYVMFFSKVAGFDLSEQVE